MICSTGTGRESILNYKGRPVKVTEEFPEQPDRGAEEEFAGRLKAVYLERLENMAGQGADAPSLFLHAKDKGEWGLG